MGSKNKHAIPYKAFLPLNHLRAIVRMHSPLVDPIPSSGVNSMSWALKSFSLFAWESFKT